MNGRFAVAAPDRQTIRPDFKHLRLRAHRRRNASSETREWRRQAETRARRRYEAPDRRGRLRRRLFISTKMAVAERKAGDRRSAMRGGVPSGDADVAFYARPPGPGGGAKRQRA